MGFKDIIEFLKAEGRVIKKCPFTFVSCALMLVAFFAIALFAYEERCYKIQLDNAAATLHTVTTDRDSYKDHLSDSKGDVESLRNQVEQLRLYRSKEPQPLKAGTLRLSNQIQEYIKSWKDSDPQPNQSENVHNYVRRFGLRAATARDDLDQDGQHSDALDKAIFDFSYSYQEVRTIAAELEKLGNKMPQ